MFAYKISVNFTLTLLSFLFIQEGCSCAQNVYSSMIVLNESVDLKAINFQTNELKVPDIMPPLVQMLYVYL